MADPGIGLAVEAVQGGKYLSLKVLQSLAQSKININLSFLL